MTLVERRAAVESWVESRLPQVVQLQQQRLAADGRYWHGPWTHDEPPQDGPGSPPDLGRSAPGRPSWAGVGAGGLFPAAMRARTQVDEYDGPLGRGWVLRIQHAEAGYVEELALPWGPHADDWPVGWRNATPDEGV